MDKLQQMILDSYVSAVANHSPYVKYFLDRYEDTLLVEAVLFPHIHESRLVHNCLTEQTIVKSKAKWEMVLNLSYHE